MSHRRAKKSARREWLVDRVTAALADSKICETIDCTSKSEDSIRLFLWPYLVNALFDVHRTLSPGLTEARLKSKADRSIVWEADVKTKISHLYFLGAPHRPDFEVLMRWAKIAVEIKRGSTGQAIREGLGQSMVYAQKYDFVVYALIDSGPDRKIIGSLGQELESAFIDSLWDNYNIKFIVI